MFKDLTGSRFGRLVAQWPAGYQGSHVMWLCLCECGKLKLALRSNLLSAKIRSCNCLQHSFHLTHGHTRGKHGANNRRSIEYGLWDSMIQRCENPKHPKYEDYGGRGIKVCRQWRKSFEKFFAHIGKRPAGKYPSGVALYSIDRIDNDGNYDPGNVRWATRSQQQFNRRKRKRSV